MAWSYNHYYTYITQSAKAAMFSDKLPVALIYSLCFDWLIRMYEVSGLDRRTDYSFVKEF